MDNRTPYTYLIGWSEQDKWYYGCRYAKNCHPDDLWVSYFTSSKGRNSVESYRKIYGEPDVKQIRKVFSSTETCLKWEHRVLKRMNVIKNIKFLNKTDNKAIASEYARKGTAAQTGIPKNHSSEGLDNIRKANSVKWIDRGWSEDKLAKALESRKARRPKGFKKPTESIETRLKKSIAHTGKPSGMLGRSHSKCSCIACRKEMYNIHLKRHVEINHLGMLASGIGRKASEETKLKMKIQRNTYINNGEIEICLVDYNFRLDFIKNNSQFEPGKLKKRGT